MFVFHKVWQFILDPEIMFAKRDKHYPSRSGQTTDLAFRLPPEIAAACECQAKNDASEVPLLRDCCVLGRCIRQKRTRWGALSDRQRSLGRMVSGIWENSIFDHFQVMVIWENVLPFVQWLLHYMVKWDNHIWLFYHLSKFYTDSGQLGEHNFIPISLARCYQH